jgi:pilus assembly protein CpaE
MTTPIPFFAVVTAEQHGELAHQVARSLGYNQAEIMIGSPAAAAQALAASGRAPRYLMLEVGSRSLDILAEIDQLAEHCTVETKVVVLGTTNDIRFYRALIQRGVLEYFVLPTDATAVREAYVSQGSGGAVSKAKVITFMSAASGDGASTVALNTAYALAKYGGYTTAIVDMDFQFGMIARNLDLTTNFGIKELFEHVDRSIDDTLIDRMMVKYDGILDIMAAPNDLRLWPDIPPEVIRQLINTLSQRYDYVIIDLPHIWSNWLAAALTCSTKSVLVAQLWLRSVTHTARLLGAWGDVGIPEDKIVSVINRSGAKFKEAVTARDYENVCRRKINFFLGNDIKTIVAAENEGKTVLQVGQTAIGQQFRDFADMLSGKPPKTAAPPPSLLNQNATRPGLSLGGLFSKNG